jgi:hypothetical protein
LKFGVIWSDGIVAPTPACLRALKLTVDALIQQGHEVVKLYVCFIPSLLDLVTTTHLSNPPCFQKGIELFLRIVSSVGGKLLSLLS